MTPLQYWNARVEAANACMAKFEGRPFEWLSTDCLRVGRFLLKQRGHSVALAKVGSYTTERGALRAMRGLGFRSMIEAMDAQGFPRIAPAQAWPADIVALAAPEPWGGSLSVKLSGSSVLGSTQGAPWAALEPKMAVAAWRID